MELLNSRGDRAPTRPLLPPSETSIVRNGSQQIELLATEAHGNPQTTLAIAKAVGCSPQTNSEGLLLKIRPTDLTENGEVELVPNWNLHPYCLVFMILEGTLQATRGEM